MQIFDRKLLQLRANKVPQSIIEPNFLKEEISFRNVEKLSELKNNFSLGLEIGSSAGEFYKNLYDETSEFYNKNKIKKLIQTDFSSNFLHKNPYPNKMVIDEEILPFNDKSFDIVVSNFSLYNINDPLSVLKKIYNILKPNGVILLSVPITGTLGKLAEAMFEAEMKIFNGASPRIHPFTNVEILGNLIQSTGFQEITVDKDKIDIMYKDFYKIFKDLKTSAQTNILINRDKKYVGKNFFNKVHEIYEKNKDHSSGCYPVTIEFANLIAWKA